MKVHTFNSDIVKPVKFLNANDSKLKFKGFAEHFDFGLTLQTYNVINNLKDRKSNFNTSYFLSDLQALSSIVELDSPYTLEKANTFTTTIKINTNFYFYPNYNDVGNYVYLQSLTDTSFLESKYLFTFNLSTNRHLFITQEITGTTYYLFLNKSSNNVSTLRMTDILPTDDTHLFRYIFEGNGIRLFGTKAKDGGSTINAESQIIKTTDYIQPTAVGTSTTTDARSSDSLLLINRHNLTANKKHYNNTLSYYLSSYNKDDINLDLSTSVESLSNNYLVFGSIYSYRTVNESLYFDIIPLKNQATNEEYYNPANHFNSEPDNLNRSYEKIFGGNNQNTGFDKLYLTYNTGTKDTHFPADKLTYFTTPSSISPYIRLNINDSKIHQLGSTAGNHPLISDKVFKRRMDIKNNNYSNEVNATYLCSWLSGNEIGEKAWVDRYYNPDYMTFNDAMSGTAFFTAVSGAGGQSSRMFDVESLLTFESNNDYAYYHIGDIDYEYQLNALSKYSLAADIAVLNAKGGQRSFNKVREDIELDFDGDRFASFITDKKGDFNFTFWLSAQDYTKPIGYKLFGNYFEEGFGVFNTDLVTPNIYIPSGNKLLLFNNDFVKYDEIELLEGDVPIKIIGVARKDIFSEFYILGENNVIYVYNSNPNLVTKITDLSGVKNIIVDDIDVTDKEIILGFNPYEVNKVKQYIKYNYLTNNIDTSNITLTNFTSANTGGTKGKIHVNNNTGNVSFFEADSQLKTGNEIATTSTNQKFVIKQIFPDSGEIPFNLIYKNIYTDTNTNTITLTAGDINSIVTNINVDDEDNLYVLYDGNRLSKHKPTRELITFTELSFLDKTSKKYIDFIYDFEGKEYKKYILIVESLSDRTILHKLDLNFSLIKTTSLGNVITNSLELTKTITSFYYLKKTGANKNRIKVKLKTKPIYTGSSPALNIEENIIDFDASQLVNGYNHFAINVSMSKGTMELYVNGTKDTTRSFAPGKYSLDNPLGTGIYIGAVSTPYNLNFSNRLLQKGKYFLRDVKMKGFRMYDRPLDYFEIQAHINYHRVNKDVVWSIPIGQRIYTDTIDRVFKFNVPEKVTNTYDVVIKGFEPSLRVQRKVTEELLKEIPKVTPYYDNVRDIVFDKPSILLDSYNIERTSDTDDDFVLVRPGDCVIKNINGRRIIYFANETEICQGDCTKVTPEDTPKEYCDQNPDDPACYCPKEKVLLQAGILKDEDDLSPECRSYCHKYPNDPDCRKDDPRKKPKFCDKYPNHPDCTGGKTSFDCPVKYQECPEGWEWSEDKCECVRIFCPPGTELNVETGECEKKITDQCPCDTDEDCLPGQCCKKYYNEDGEVVSCKCEECSPPPPTLCPCPPPDDRLPNGECKPISMCCENWGLEWCEELNRCCKRITKDCPCGVDDETNLCIDPCPEDNGGGGGECVSPKVKVNGVCVCPEGTQENSSGGCDVLCPNGDTKKPDEPCACPGGGIPNPDTGLCDEDCPGGDCGGGGCDQPPCTNTPPPPPPCPNPPCGQQIDNTPYQPMDIIQIFLDIPPRCFPRTKQGSPPDITEIIQSGPDAGRYYPYDSSGDEEDLKKWTVYPDPLDENRWDTPSVTKRIRPLRVGAYTVDLGGNQKAIVKIEDHLKPRYKFDLTIKGGEERAINTNASYDADITEVCKQSHQWYHEPTDQQATYQNTVNTGFVGKAFTITITNAEPGQDVPKLTKDDLPFGGNTIIARVIREYFRYGEDPNFSSINGRRVNYDGPAIWGITHTGAINVTTTAKFEYLENLQTKQWSELIANPWDLGTGDTMKLSDITGMRHGAPEKVRVFRLYANASA